MTQCDVEGDDLVAGTASLSDPLWTNLGLEAGSWVKVTLDGASKFFQAYKRPAGTGELVLVRNDAFGSLSNGRQGGEVKKVKPIWARLKLAFCTWAGWLAIVGVLIAVAGSVVQGVNASNDKPNGGTIALGVGLQIAGLLLVYVGGVVKMSPS